MTRRTVEEVSQYDRGAALATLKLGLLAGALVVLASGLKPIAAHAQGDPRGPEFDWGLAQGFSLEVHSESFSFPTVIAMVENPGVEDESPLYHVAPPPEALEQTRATPADSILSRLANPGPILPIHAARVAARVGSSSEFLEKIVRKAGFEPYLLTGS